MMATRWCGSGGPVRRAIGALTPAQCLMAFTFAAQPVCGQSFTSAFETDYGGWIADFADYPAADSAAWHFKHSIETMPNVTPTQKGLRISGDNFSDDLFLFIKRKVTGLVPGAEYAMTVNAGIVTAQCPDCLGGDSFYFKAGAGGTEPKKVLASGGMYRMNIDKGNQSRGGPDMDTVAAVYHDVPGDLTPHLMHFGNAKHPFRFHADAKGEAWVILGVESAFETPVAWNLADVSVQFAGTTGLRPGPAPVRFRQVGLRSRNLAGRRLPLNPGRLSP